MADIAVWVKGREKLLSGVSRVTTCQDIVKTLLTDKVSKRCIENFALYEKWRDCERPLAPQTRVYKLWKAWGSERENVTFVLRKYKPTDKIAKKDTLKLKEESTNKMWKTSKRKNGDQKRRDKGLTVREGNSHKQHKMCRNNGQKDNAHYDHQTLVQHRSVMSNERTEFVLSDTCGPEMIRTEDATSLPTSLLNVKKSPSETFNQLLQLVVRQSQQLEELLQQAQNIDREIEFYETKMHLLRVEANGKNYVQEAYLAHDEDSESKMAEIIAGLYSSGTKDDLDTYIDLYNKILNVEEQLNEKQNTITSLSQQLEEQRCSSRCQDFSPPSTMENLTSTPISSRSNCERLHGLDAEFKSDIVQAESSVLQDDIGFARAQLKKSAQTCIAQKTDLGTLQTRLHATEALLDDKCHWMRVLTVELHRLEDIEKRMILQSTEVTSLDENHDREEKRLRELLKLVRQPLQPIQEKPEEEDEEENEDNEDADESDSISQTSIDEINLTKKLVVSDDASSDTGLSSLHSQDEPFEIIMETLV